METEDNLFLTLLFSPRFLCSGQGGQRVHLDPARAGRGQVRLRAARGALAAHPHGDHHHDERHLHDHRPQPRVTG